MFSLDCLQDKDPFLEDPKTEVLVGIVQVYLQPLAFLVELKEQLEILDFKGAEIGIINIEIVPCTSDGRELSELDDAYVDTPSELIGKDVCFVFKIHGCRGLPPRFTVISMKMNSNRVNLILVMNLRMFIVNTEFF